MKKWMVRFLAVVMLFALTGCGTKETDHAKNEANPQTSTTTKPVEKIEKSAIPTVFIHGYGGTINSFGGMIRRLSSEGMTKKEMVITVQPDGTLQVEGRLSKKKDNPSIQVLFAANKDNEWHQTEWIYTVLTYLKKQGVDQVNLVGHSMGGVSSLRYLTTYGEPKDTPKIRKFIAIGAPFNDFNDTSDQQTIEEVLKNGPNPQSSRYVDYTNGITNVPTELPIMLMAGKLDTNTTSDGTVPLNSALATYSLLKAHGNSVEEKIFTGADAQHSQLHENLAVDQAVAAFLWN